MKFHSVAIILAGACAYLFYIFIFGFKNDLQEARATIQKESVATAKNIEKVNTQPELKPFINKALVDNRANVYNNLYANAPRENITSPTEDQQIFSTQLDEKGYWCRNVPLRIETAPVKCNYPDACFGCNGPIIPPEIPSATPLCVDGTTSKIYHVECCPSISDGTAVCPSVEQCFNAESVPADACKCQDSPSCRILQVNDRFECICDEQQQSY